MNFRRIIVCSIICLFFLNKANAQQKFQRIGSKVNRSNLEIGYHNTDYLNKRYVSNINSGSLNQLFGLNIGYRGIRFPFSFDLAYTYTAYRTDINLLNTVNNKNLSENIVSSSLNIYLFHFSHRILPSVGIGYNYGNLGTAGSQSKADEQGVYVARNINHPFIKFQTELNLFKRLGFNLFYTRSFISEFDRSTYGVSLKLYPRISIIKK